MKIKYYGVRGSIATPGKSFEKYGGNTTCVCIETDKDLFILDAGTGIRNLGNDLLKRQFGSKEGGKAHIFFSHTHWDHIQGFPFFLPAYLPQNEFTIYGETKEIKSQDENNLERIETWSIERTLSTQQTFMFFPASTQNMGAKLKFNEINHENSIKTKTTEIKTLRIFHPNNSVAFLFDFFGKKYCFCTDVEHNDLMIEKISDFAKDADILAFDCQYTPDEYENGRKGWGHSTYEIAAEICNRAGVKNLHMIHHDPSHDDKMIDDIHKKALRLFKNTTAICEGQEFFI